MCPMRSRQQQAGLNDWRCFLVVCRQASHERFDALPSCRACCTFVRFHLAAELKRLFHDAEYFHGYSQFKRGQASFDLINVIWSHYSFWRRVNSIVAWMDAQQVCKLFTIYSVRFAYICIILQKHV